MRYPEEVYLAMGGLWDNDLPCTGSLGDQGNADVFEQEWIEHSGLSMLVTPVQSNVQISSHFE